jgi:hypothetical protein
MSWYEKLADLDCKEKHDEPSEIRPKTSESRRTDFIKLPVIFPVLRESQGSDCEPARAAAPIGVAPAE